MKQESMPLKTLKDIGIRQTQSMLENAHRAKAMDDVKAKLREEAIKWIKSFYMEGTQKEHERTINWIAFFFNLDSYEEEITIEKPGEV